MKKRSGKRARSEATRSGWNKKEDKHLLELTATVKHFNWRIICKQQNEKFPEKARTPEECEGRYNVLSGIKPAANEEWTVGETCALLCTCLLHEGDWKVITASLPTRPPKEVHKYLVKMIKEVAGMAKEKRGQEVDAKNSTETFKIFTCIKLVLDNLSSGTSCQPVAKFVRKAQLGKDDCLEFLNSVGKEAKIGAEWNYDKLNSYLIKTVENIQNGVYSINREDMDGTLDGLIHEKPEPVITMPFGLQVPRFFVGY